MPMSYKRVTTFIVLLFAIYCCSPIKYHYPEGLSKEKLKELKGRTKSGKKLYKSYCSNCHGIFTKGKDSISNFSQTQFDSYTKGFIRGDYKNHAFTSNLEDNQLEDILIFLYVIRKDST